MVLFLFSATLILASTSFLHAAQFKVTEQIYFDIAQEDELLGRITLGLFGEITPKTVKNFVHLATIGIDGKTYEGTRFHRVIPKFMVQGGDVLNNNGTGSVSIYGKYFDDENFEVKHTAAGFISMANAGKNTNGCQFFITTIATPWLDGHHTVFGKVVDGQDIVHKIEQVKTDSDDEPLKDVIVQACGIIPTPKPFYVSDDLFDLWSWLRAAIVPLGFSLTILGLFHWMINKLNI